MVSGAIPVDKIHDDEFCIGFHDIHPQAPVHVLFIPKRHLSTLNEATVEDRELLGALTIAATNFAKKHGFAESGYRLVANCNKDGGQTVFHVHLHLLGKRSMAWPPG